MPNTPSSPNEEPVEEMDELDTSGVTEEYQNEPDGPEYCEFGCMPMDHGEEPPTVDDPDEERIESLITPHGMWQMLPPLPVPEPRELSDEERLEAARRYIERKYSKVMRGNYTSMVQHNPEGSSEMDASTCISCRGPRSDSPRPGCHRNDFHYDFLGQQPTAREYKAMVSRVTDGSDPLVQEPKDKLWTTTQLCQRGCRHRQYHYIKQHEYRMSLTSGARSCTQYVASQHSLQ